MNCTVHEWDNKVDFLDENNLYIGKVQGDGFCFLHALQASLLTQCNIQYSIPDLCHVLMTYILDNCAELSHFHYSEEKMLNECLDFFCKQEYNQDAVDIIVSSAAAALGVSVTIYRNNKGMLYQQKFNNRSSEYNVQLLFTESVQNAMLNHYEALIPSHIDYYRDRKDPEKLGEILKEFLQKNNKSTKKVDEILYEFLNIHLIHDNLPDTTLGHLNPVPETSFTSTPDVSLISYNDDDDCSIIEELSTFPEADVSIVKVDESAPKETERESANTAVAGSGKVVSSQTTKIGTNAESGAQQTEESKRNSSFVEQEAEGEKDDESAKSHRYESAVLIAKHLWDPTYRMDIREESRLPGDVDGSCCYIIATNEHTWKVDTQDQRNFEMHTSKRSGLEGFRKTGHCLGAYVCQNDSCPFLAISENGVPNHTQFQNVNKMKICKSCEQVANRVPCGLANQRPYKIIEYHKKLKTAIVWHYGFHTCYLKLTLRSNKNALNKRLDEIAKTPGMSIHEYGLESAGRYFDAGDIVGMVKEIDLFVDPAVAQRVQKQRRRLEVPDMHSFDAIAILKRNAGKQRESTTRHRFTDFRCFHIADSRAFIFRLV